MKKTELEKNYIATSRLSEIIPIKDIEKFLRIYEHFKNLEIAPYNPAYELITDAERLLKLLKKLRRRGYITDDGIRNILNNFFINLSIYDDPLKIGALFYEFYFKKRGGPYYDKALYFLLACLFEAWPGIPDYELIADFLSERLNKIFTGRAIMKRHERMKPKEISDIGDFYSLLGFLFKQMTPAERKEDISKILTDFIADTTPFYPKT